MRVFKSKQAEKFIAKQDAPTRERLNDALSKLPAGDIVPVSGMTDTYRLRVGGFRALFVKEGDIIKVTIIDSRGQIYKNI